MHLIDPFTRFYARARRKMCLNVLQSKKVTFMTPPKVAKRAPKGPKLIST